MWDLRGDLEQSPHTPCVDLKKKKKDVWAVTTKHTPTCSHRIDFTSQMCS